MLTHVSADGQPPMSTTFSSVISLASHDEPPGQPCASTRRNRLAHADGRNQRALYPDLLLRTPAAGARRAIAGPGTTCAARMAPHTPLMASAHFPPWMRETRKPRPSRSGSLATPTSSHSARSPRGTSLSTDSAWAVSNGMVGKPSRRPFLFRPACWSPPTTFSA